MANNCLDWKSSELIELAKQVGVESTPAFADKVGTLMDKISSSERHDISYQNLTGKPDEEYVASEKTIRDLAARISDRIGVPVKFESDRTKDYKGKIENDVSYVNLAYATLDTPIHEILGHPIIRAIKNNKQTDVTFRNNPNGMGIYVTNKAGEENYYPFGIEAYNNEKGVTVLYNNLLKELEYGKGKEVLDRVKRDYVYKYTREYHVKKNDGKYYIFYKEPGDIYWGNSLKPDGSFSGMSFYADSKEFISKADAQNYIDVELKDFNKYTIEEQQEEAIVELLGLYTADRLDKVKDGKLISLLKRLLKEMKAFMKQLLGQKEVEIDKLPDNMTLGDIADLLAYSNSKLILPGYEVEYTTPDNEKFKTYQEASNHISELAKSVEDVDLSNVGLNIRKKISNISEIPVNRFTDEFMNDDFERKNGIWYYEGTDTVIDDDVIVTAWNSNISENNLSKSAVEGFIDKNKEYEQSKEIIEGWKKVNNIQYNPEEVYSRGQEFVSVIGAYSDFDVNLMMQNLLQHIEDNQKAGGQFAISAFTKPINKQIGHLEGGGGKIKFKIYPQSNDILWAANSDVFSGSVWDASEKVNKDKKSELLGVSYTKYPSLGNVDKVKPNLAEIIDNLDDHHNELGVVLTGNNFRLEYDEDIPYTTKKIIDGINKILDQKYGNIVKPKIEKTYTKLVYGIVGEYNYDTGSTIIEEFEKEDDAKKWIDINGKEYEQLIGLAPTIESYKKIGIQPTQTNETLKESIESIKIKYDDNIEDTDNMGSYGYEVNGVRYVKSDDGTYLKRMNISEKFIEITKEEYENNKPKSEISKKEYNSQALINTKIAALKEVAKKYPRSLTRSEVKKYVSNVGNTFSGNGLSFQKVSNNLPTPEQLKEYLSTNKPNKNIYVENGKAKVKPQGLSYAEVKLPAWTKMFFGKDMQNANGDVDFVKINKMLQEVMDMIGYRIPTEDKYSILPLRVVGFLPSNSGGGIMLPSEITTISGSDFDVDKMYVMFKHIINSKDGLHVEQYLDDDNSTIQERKDNYTKRLPEANNIRLSYKDRIKAINDKIKEAKSDKSKNIAELQLEKKSLSEDWTDLAEELRGLEKLSPEDVLIYRTIDKLDMGDSDVVVEYKDKLTKKLDAVKASIAKINKSIEESKSGEEKETGNNVATDLQKLYSEKSDLYSERDSKISNLISDEEFKNIPVEEQNTKTARDNRLIDIMLGIMRNSNTAEAIFNPGGYANLKDNVAVKIREAIGNKTKHTNMFDANDVDAMTVQNTAGRDFKGIGASHNGFRPLLELSNLKSEINVLFNGKSLTDFSGKESNGKDTDGESIARSVAEIVAAAVDNGKDPLLAAINYNQHTADLIFMLLSMGVPPMTVFAFMNQADIRDAVNKVLSGEATSIKSVLSESFKKLNAGKSFNPKNNHPTNMNENDIKVGETKVLGLLSTINKTNNKEVLNNALNYIMLADDFSKLIKASKADTAGIGKYTEEGLSLVDNIKDAKSVKNISGISEFLSGIGENKMTKAFTEYGVERPIDEIMKHIIPYSNGIFSKIKTRINSILTDNGRSSLSAEERQGINRNIIQFLSSQIPFYNVNEESRVAFIKNLPNIYNKYVRLFKNDKAPNKLLSSLNTKEDKFLKLTMLGFDKNLIQSTEQVEDLQHAWKEMYNPEAKLKLLNYIHSVNPKSTLSIEAMNPEMIAKALEDGGYKDNIRFKELAKAYVLHEFSNDLIHYSFYITGHEFTPKSISSMIPLEVYMNIPEVIDKIRGIESVEYGDEVAVAFIKQYAQHNPGMTKLIPRATMDVDTQNVSVANEARVVIDYTSKNIDSSEFVRFEGENLIAVDFLSFLKKDEKSGTSKLMLYEKSSISKSEVVYIRINRAGSKGQITEYTSSSPITTSIIESNNITKQELEAINKESNCK